MFCLGRHSCNVVTKTKALVQPGCCDVVWSQMSFSSVFSWNQYSQQEKARVLKHFVYLPSLLELMPLNTGSFQVPFSVCCDHSVTPNIWNLTEVSGFPGFFTTKREKCSLNFRIAFCTASRILGLRRMHALLKDGCISLRPILFMDAIPPLPQAECLPLPLHANLPFICFCKWLSWFQVYSCGLPSHGHGLVSLNHTV